MKKVVKWFFLCVAFLVVTAVGIEPPKTVMNVKKQTAKETTNKGMYLFKLKIKYFFIISPPPLLQVTFLT